MSEEERFQAYINTFCSKCKNKNNYDCEIRISRNVDSTTVIKCEYYERED